jgi:hypothetical protein
MGEVVLPKRRIRRIEWGVPKVKRQMGLVPFWDSRGIRSPRSPALRDRYNRRYFGTGGGRIKRSAARELHKLCASRD